MKKKLLLTLLCLTMTLCCVLGLVACGGDGDDGEAKLTEQQWQTSVTSVASNGDFSIKTTSGATVNTMKLTGTTYYDASGDREVIFTKEGSDYYRYYKANASASWSKSKVTEQEYNSAIEDGSVGFAVAAVTALAQGYENFTYSNGKYTLAEAQISQEFTLKDIEVTVKNKKIVKIVCTVSSGGIDTLVTIDSIGSTEVQVPTVTAAPKLTETQWQSCLNAFVTAKNFSLALEAGGAEVGAMKLVGATYYDKVGSEERIFVKDGDNYIEFDNDGGDWTMTTSTEADYNENVNENAVTLVQGAAAALIAAYDDYDYDNGTYSLDTLTVTAGFTLNDIVITVDGNKLTGATCVWAGAPDKTVTISDITTTEIDMPVIKTVSDDQWVTALQRARDNFTLTHTYKYNQYSTFESVYKIDGVKAYERVEKASNRYTTEYVYTTGGTHGYQFNRQDGYTRWGREDYADASDGGESLFLTHKSSVATLLDGVRNLKESFAYNSNTGKYTCTDYEAREFGTDKYSIITYTVELEFVNGKLVAAKYTWDKNTVVFGDIGSTAVTVPTDFYDL